MFSSDAIERRHVVRREDRPLLRRRIEYTPVAVEYVGRLLGKLGLLILVVLAEDSDSATLKVDVGPRDASSFFIGRSANYLGAANAGEAEEGSPRPRRCGPAV